MGDKIHIDDLRFPNFTAEELRALAAAEANPVDLCADAILAAATQRTGLTDFGEGDYKDRLELMVRDVAEDPDSTEFNKREWFNQHVNHAVNRLSMREMFKRHPEIRDTEIRAPVIVSGLPRSGTTHLVNLMGADSRFRTLTMWESRQFVPDDMKRPLSPSSEDPRYQRLASRLQSEAGVLPLRSLMHPIDPLHIEEDGWLGSASFSGFGPECDRRAPKWRAYYENADMTEYYTLIRDAMQILQWLRPKERWLTKNVQNVEHIAVISKVFPDATLVCTHRDPVAVIQSLATMYLYRSRMHYKTQDPKFNIEWYTHMIRRMLYRHVKQRELVAPGRIIDVYFDKYMKDQIGTVEKVYEHANFPLTDVALGELNKYIDDHPRGKEGAVTYDLAADFGVSPDSLNKQFGFYFNKLPVKVEVT